MLSLHTTRLRWTAVVSLFFIGLPGVYGQDSLPVEPSTGFDPLYLYYGAKLIPAALFMGTAMTSPDSEPIERLLVGSGAFLVGLTSAGVLHHATHGNPAATRAFRMGAFGVDLAVSIAIASWGVYLMGEGNSGEQLAGLAVVSIGTAGVMVAGVNLAPLQVERRRPRPD